MKISIGSVIGVLFCFGMLAVGVTETIGVTTFVESIPALAGNPFLNIPSLFIVLGGILQASLITYQPRYVGKALMGIIHLFSQAKTSKKTLQKDFETVVEWSDDIKKDRVGALNKLESEHGGEISGYLFSLLSTNYSSDDIEIVDVLRAMGGAAPSFGMFGTLFGLIVMLGELDDPSNMGPGLAAALMTTLYGIIFARFVFYPLAEKIKNSAQINKFREYFLLEGIILINDKKSSFYIQDKLSTYLQRDFKKQKAE
jgi:chemotaxis protein MotA